MCVFICFVFLTVWVTLYTCSFHSMQFVLDVGINIMFQGKEKGNRNKFHLCYSSLTWSPLCIGVQQWLKILLLVTVMTAQGPSEVSDSHLHADSYLEHQGLYILIIIFEGGFGSWLELTEHFLQQTVENTVCGKCVSEGRWMRGSWQEKQLTGKCK